MAGPDRPAAIVSRRREQVLRDLQAQRRGASGVAPTWNGRSLLALRSYRISRAGAREDAKLDLETSPVDYATFATTVLGLDAEFDLVDGETGQTTLRREYLSSRAIEKEAVARPIPFLANGIGVALVAFTVDDKFLLARRRPQARARGGERDVSVVEGMHVDLDRLPMTAAQVLHAQTLHAKDRWEARLEPVDIDPTAVFTRIRDDGMWDLGLVTTYFALSSRCGPAAVGRAADRVLG